MKDYLNHLKESVECVAVKYEDVHVEKKITLVGNNLQGGWLP
jgi:hypothetical protein